MKKRNQLALRVSFLVFIGFPILFFCVSLYTEQWGYLMWSFPPSLFAGLTGLIFTLHTRKREKKGA
jgi:hypothetical protein